MYDRNETNMFWQERKAKEEQKKFFVISQRHKFK